MGRGPETVAEILAALDQRLAAANAPSVDALWPSAEPPEIAASAPADPGALDSGYLALRDRDWRRARGAYYTPAPLVTALIDALDIPPTASALDPACGSGRFLRALAATRPLDAWATTLRGYDTDPVAVTLARGALALDAAERGAALTPEALAAMVRWSDALAAPELLGERFDVVLGNPPFVSARRCDAEQRRRLVASGRFPSLGGRWDLALPFVDLALDCLSPEGRHGYVMPAAFATEGYAEASRRRLGQALTLQGVLQLDGAGAFAGAQVSGLVYFGRAPGPTRTPPPHFQRRLGELPALGPPTGQGADDAPLRARSRPVPTPLGAWAPLRELCLVIRGPELQSHERHDPEGGPKRFVKDDLIAEARGPGRRPYVEGRDIGEASQPRRTRWLEWDSDRVPSQLRRPRIPALLSQPKLLMAITSGGVLYDPEGRYACNHSVNLVLRLADIPVEVEARVVEALRRDKAIGDTAGEHLAQGRAHSAALRLDYLHRVLADPGLRERLEAAGSRDRADLYPDDVKSWPIPLPAGDVQARVARGAQPVASLFQW